MQWGFGTEVLQSETIQFPGHTTSSVDRNHSWICSLNYSELAHTSGQRDGH